ncbi:MAG: hypothetical protein JXJ04_02810 [Spirochaetales bacterium]|nr:hypothetical protein [Spirochaetales bacterium]
MDSTGVPVDMVSTFLHMSLTRWGDPVQQGVDKMRTTLKEKNDFTTGGIKRNGRDE